MVFRVVLNLEIVRKGLSFCIVKIDLLLEVNCFLGELVIFGIVVFFNLGWFLGRYKILSG